MPAEGWLSSCEASLRGQCAQFVPARPATRWSEAVVARPEGVDGLLSCPSVLHSADRPPFARLSQEHGPHRADCPYAMLRARPQFLLARRAPFERMPTRKGYSELKVSDFVLWYTLPRLAP